MPTVSDAVYLILLTAQGARLALLTSVHSTEMRARRTHADHGGVLSGCSGTMSTRLLEEAIIDENASEGTCQLVGMLLELERSRERAVGHLWSSAISDHYGLQH